MKEIVQQFYTEFLLRDILGYMVPGGLLLVAIFLVYGTKDQKKVIFGDGTSECPPLIKSTPVWALCLATSYLMGHAISGFAFNIWEQNPVFAYYPHREIPDNETMGAHVVRFNTAVDAAKTAGLDLSKTLQQRERYAALLHLTGHGAASVFLVSVLFLVHRRREVKSAEDAGVLNSGYVLPAIVFLCALGLWIHHNQLKYRRLTFETGVITKYIPFADQSSDTGAVSPKDSEKPSGE